jgi:hypothetical protein
MLSFTDYELKDIMIDQIDLEDDYYKISKLPVDDKLKQSIQSTGLLDPPVLIINVNPKANLSYQIISGHNRINILKELDYKFFPAIVHNKLEPDFFISNSLLKCYRQEISSIGKIKVYFILKYVFHLSEAEISGTVKVMQIPAEILNSELPEKILSLPRSLKDYLDVKDIGFKVIKNLLRLSDETILLVSGWISGINVRVNIFKSIVDYIVDIIKRDKTLKALAGIDPAIFSDNKRMDETLFNEVFKIRYPNYTRMKSSADEIINVLRKDGIEIDFPEYFESDEISVVLKVSKKEGIDGLSKKKNKIDVNAIKNLLELI